MCKEKIIASWECVPEDAEILTIDGWKHYSEISVGNQVLTLNLEKDILEYNPIEKIITKNFNGKLMFFNSRAYSLPVTARHRMIFSYERWKRPPQIKVAEKFTKWNVDHKRFLSAGYFSGKEKYSDDLIRLIAWILTEGHDEKEHGWGRISIVQSRRRNPEFVKEIRSLLRKLDIHFTETFDKKYQRQTFYISKESYKWVKENVLKGNIKKIPKEVLLASNRQLRLFWQELCKGDGRKRYVSLKKTLQTIVEERKSLVDQYQELCIKIGLRAYIKKVNAKSYRLNIAPRAWSLCSIKNIDYRGKVWCPVTRNGTWVGRYNDKPFITGNSACNDCWQKLEKREREWMIMLNHVREFLRSCGVDLAELEKMW